MRCIDKPGKLFRVDGLLLEVAHVATRMNGTIDACDFGVGKPVWIAHVLSPEAVG
jgi:hypothetical protein